MRTLFCCEAFDMYLLLVLRKSVVWKKRRVSIHLLAMRRLACVMHSAAKHVLTRACLWTSVRLSLRADTLGKQLYHGYVRWECEGK